MEGFETGQLAGRPLSTEDRPHYLALLGDPAVAATLTVDGQAFPQAEAESVVERALAHWRAHRFGVYSLRSRRNGRFLGYSGLRHVVINGRAEVELLYATAAEHWGQGIATEAARVVLAVAPVEGVAAVTLPTNRGSRRVMEKCGLTFERTVVHAGLPHVLYRLRDC